MNLSWNECAAGALGVGGIGCENNPREEILGANTPSANKTLAARHSSLHIRLPRKYEIYIYIYK